MPTTNKYDDMSALTALKNANSGMLLLPDIQREYVWDISEIESLFESIVDDYPIGSYIMWKTTKKVINEERPNLYRFLKFFEKGKTKNECAPEILTEDDYYYIVLDGQQRITSMNIALNGTYTYYKGGRGHDRNNPKSWITKELYYDLDFYADKAENDDEHPGKRFVFLSKEESHNGNYYKVKELLAFESSDDFIENLISSGIDKKSRSDLSRLFNRLHDSSANSLVHFYCISENTYDEALDIFVRVNSTGKKLSKSDLLFSTLIDGWSNGKENVETLLSVMNHKGDGFLFSRDYLMRACLVLVDADTNLKINSLTQKTIQTIRDNWSKIHKAMDMLTDTLSDIGMCDENLTSYNATMPIAYYLYCGGKLNDKESKKEVKKFLSVSLAKRLFGVASNSALRSTRNSLKVNGNKKFSLDIFSSINLVGDRTFKVTESDIDRWLDNYEKGPNTYVLLSLLYPNLKLSQIAFHQDHCHPYMAFDRRKLSALGFDEDKIKDWEKKRNLLPNLQFLKDSENESKNDRSLLEWVSNGNEFDYHPLGVSLELKNFDTFFEERRKLIKSKLLEIFEIDISDFQNQEDK